MSTKIIYSNKYHRHDNPSHPENARRLDAIINEIRNSRLTNKIEFIEPSMLSEKILYDVHTTEMIEQVKITSTYDEYWLDPDTYVSKDSYEIALLAAGGVVKACENVINGEYDNAFVLARPPGHHATKTRSMGFCLFNNAAIAANELTKKGKRVLIFDPDVHHGNGTQDIFYDRKDVMYQSTHLSPHYPGTGSISETGTGDGEGFTINAPLPYGVGDKSIARILDEIFIPVAQQFKPDFIIFSCGYDSHHMDPLGGMKLTANFYGEMIKKYQQIQPKIVCTLEGGYNLQWIGKCCLSQISHLANDVIKIDDKCNENQNVDQIVNKIKSEIGGFWKV
jgi:acetoin utilization deacetylase AcuC-like enzyme